MDHTGLSATQHDPTNPYPLTDSYSSSYNTNYTYNPPLLTTQNPNPLKPHELYGGTVGLRPPGVDSYTYLHAHQAQSGVEAYSFPAADAGPMAAPSAYYQDPNAQNWAAVIEAVRLYGANPVAYAPGVTIPPNGTEQPVTAIPNSTLWINTAVQPRGNGTWKRTLKKTKIVQSLYCEICKIDCSSRVVYEHHVIGKKHKRNLEKLNEAGASVPSTSAVSTNSVIGPQEKAVSGQKTKKKQTDSLQNLETKRRKVLEGGAAAHAVRSCAICNVVCNSDTVFNFHLSGQKHAAMVKKYGAATSFAAAM